MNENPPIVQRITSASQVDAYRGNSIYELITDKNGRRVFVHRDGAEFNRFIKPNCEKRLFYYINTGDLELSYRFDDVYYCSERLSADVKFKVRLCPAVDLELNPEFADWIVGRDCEFLSIGDLADSLSERLKQYFSAILNGATTLALIEQHGAGAVSDDKTYWTDAGLPSWLEIVETSSIQARGEASQELIKENDRIARARERQRNLLERIDIVVTEDKLANVKDEIAHRNDMLRKQRELELQEHNHLVAKRQLEWDLELLKRQNDIRGVADKEEELKKKEKEITSVCSQLKIQSEETFCAIVRLFKGVSGTLDDICRSTTKTAANTDLMVSLLKKIAGIIADDHTMSQYRSFVTRTRPSFVINNQFEMIRRIGSGEQGDVYQAYDRNVGKTVAVKCLDPRTTKDDAIWRRLVEEGEILLSIPRTVEVNLPWFRSSGREIDNGDKPFFVMEFIDGYALSSVLKHRAISTECTKEEFSIQILLQIATAVDYLHKHNVIHRDIKSGNIIFSHDAGAAYLVDFGSACTLSDTENWNEKIKVASGTLPYMSPEQRQELPPSFSQDIFSFSVLAYECFTGEYPFNVQDFKVKDSVEWNRQLVEAKAKLDNVQIPLQIKDQILSGLSYNSENRPKNCSVILGANEVCGGVIETESSAESIVAPKSQESSLNVDSSDEQEPIATIPCRDISLVKCGEIPAQIFSGEPVRPECHLVDEEFDYTLEKGKDYIVQYESVDVPGFATVVITGIGEYCGEKRVQFEIKKDEIPKPIPFPLKKIPCDQFEDYEGVYDGKIHGLGLIENACVPEIDAQLTWFNNKTKSWEKKFPEFVDVCDRTFTVKITAPGYAEHTELRRIRILPKPLSLDMVENVSFSEYEDGDGGFTTSRLKMKDVEPCVIQDKDWAIVETGTKTDLIVVTGRGNYCGTLEIKIKEDKNSTEDFYVGSPQSKQGRKWRAWLQLLGSLLLIGVLWAPIDWSGILSFNSDFDKGENQFSDFFENVSSSGWGFNPTPYERVQSDLKGNEKKVADTVVSEKEVEFITYVIQRGDTLSKISQCYDIKVDDIVANNPHIKNYVVRLGQKIKLPGKVNVGRQVVASTRKETAELVKEAHAALVQNNWKIGFDIATNISMNAISDSYVTYYVGYCYSPTYQTAYPIKKDFEKAYKWFKYTAELEQKSGDGIVQCILGDMEKNGQGCAANIDNAVAWYRISAERKYGRGCYKLGKCYENNIVADTNDNLVAATNWYFKAMELKYGKAKGAYERVLKEIKERETAKGDCLSAKIAEQEDWTYFKLSIKPTSEMNVIPKDVVVLLDCSGSMGRLRLNNCFANIEKNLRSCMNPGDRFNLVAYHGDDNCSYVFNSWQQCTEESYEKASKWMNSLSPYGRGNVLGAVESVFKLSRDSKRPLIVLVITDKISDNQADETLSRKLSSFTKHNDGSVSVYLYCCSKRFHNRTLVDVFTCVNGGECLFSNSRLASTSADDLQSLFIRFRNPILAGLHPVFTDDTKTELISTNMKNFYLNEVVDVIGRVPRGTKDISFSIKGYDGKDMHELFFKCNLSNGESDKNILDFWKDTQTFLRVGCLQKANQNVVAVEVDHNKVNPVKRVQLWKDGPYWADRNIGAETPWDSGYYFWWGDPVGYKYKDEKWERAGRWVPNAFLLEKTICKKNISELCNKGYIELYEKGWFTDKYILTSMYDAAHVQLGGVWRMPTDNECLELCKKCTWDLMKTNGVYGWVVRGKDDYSSKSIFLPLAGSGDEKTLHGVTYGGWYWSSVPSSSEYEHWGEEGNLGAMCLYFNWDRKHILTQSRYQRLPIRPIQGFTK